MMMMMMVVATLSKQRHPLVRIWWRPGETTADSPLHRPPSTTPPYCTTVRSHLSIAVMLQICWGFPVPCCTVSLWVMSAPAPLCRAFPVYRWCPPSITYEQPLPPRALPILNYTPAANHALPNHLHPPLSTIMSSLFFWRSDSSESSVHSPTHWQMAVDGFQTMASSLLPGTPLKSIHKVCILCIHRIHRIQSINCIQRMNTMHRNYA